jgi:hypothetical protein
MHVKVSTCTVHALDSVEAICDRAVNVLMMAFSLVVVSTQGPQTAHSQKRGLTKCCSNLKTSNVLRRIKSGNRIAKTTEARAIKICICTKEISSRGDGSCCIKQCVYRLPSKSTHARAHALSAPGIYKHSTIGVRRGLACTCPLLVELLVDEEQGVKVLQREDGCTHQTHSRVRTRWQP